MCCAGPNRLCGRYWLCSSSYLQRARASVSWCSEGSTRRQEAAPCTCPDAPGHLDVAVPLLDSPASQIMHTLMLGSSELIRISGRAAGLLVHKLLAALQTPVRCPGVMRNERTPHARTPCPTGLGSSRVHSYFQRSCARPGLGPRRRLPAT